MSLRTLAARFNTLITTNTDKETNRQPSHHQLVFPPSSRGQGADEGSQPVQLLLNGLPLAPLQTPVGHLAVQTQRQAPGGFLQTGLLRLQTVLAPTGLLRGRRTLCGGGEGG